MYLVYGSIEAANAALTTDKLTSEDAQRYHTTWSNQAHDEVRHILQSGSDQLWSGVRFQFDLSKRHADPYVGQIQAIFDEEQAALLQLAQTTPPTQ